MRPNRPVSQSRKTTPTRINRKFRHIRTDFGLASNVHRVGSLRKVTQIQAQRIRTTKKTKATVCAKATFARSLFAAMP